MQMIYIFFGMVASGKSTLARSFAGRHHIPCYNTDRVRKELAGLTPTGRRPDGINQGIYSKEFTGKTYQAMLERTRKDIDAGKSGVVLDGSYHRRHEREQVRRMAMELGVSCKFIHCICHEGEVRRRLEKRSRDPKAVSDGRWEVYLAQKKNFEQPDELLPAELIVLDTENDVDMLLERLEVGLDMKNM